MAYAIGWQAIVPRRPTGRRGCQSVGGTPDVRDPLILRGDAIETLRREVPGACIDMAYLDPPFGTGLDWHGKAGRFSDRHRWDKTARAAQAELSTLRAWPVLAAAGALLAPSQRAYLFKMAQLFCELRRVLKRSGSLWLHCDDTMGHYLRCALDVVFGPENALGAVIWRRTGTHSSARHFGRVHDTIYVAGRTRAARRKLARCGGEFLCDDPSSRVVIDGFAEDRLGSTSKERTGYPTQKPVALLERLIRCATRPGDLVLDACCGSGTALAAAKNLGRASIGIDRSAAAVAIARKRAA